MRTSSADLGILAVVEVVLIAALACAIGAVGVAAALELARRGRLRRGESVIVCTRRPDDQSIQGVVDRHDRHGISLFGAHYLEPSADPTPIGATFIPRDAISFVQTGVTPIPVVSRPDQREALPLPDTRRPARLRGVEA